MRRVSLIWPRRLNPGRPSPHENPGHEYAKCERADAATQPNLGGPMNKSLTTTATLVALVALATTGCASTTTGTPAAITGPTQTSRPSSTGAARTANPTGAGPLASVDPCSLLSQETATQNQLTPGAPEKEVGARTCHWDKNADENSAGYSLSVGIYDDAGLSQLNTQDIITNYPVGHHQGRLDKYTDLGTCKVALGVTDNSMVVVLGVDGGGALDNACKVATKFAPLVEPKLPPGSG